MKMAEVRVRLLQENEELRELNERITNLQKLLIEKIDGQPEMKELTRELELVTDRLRSWKNDNP